MESCYDVIHGGQCLCVGDVEVAFVVDDVEFSSHEECHVAILAWHDMLIAEIDGWAGARYCRTVFGDSEDGEVVALCLGYHLVECAECMA